MGDLFARIGKTKVSYLLEDEIRSLGDHCVLPLRSYLLSAGSRQEPKKRALAARILSDVTQPWFVPEFIDLLMDEDGEIRYYAATGLARLTQRNFGTSAEAWRDDSANERALHHARWRNWWDEKSSDYPGGPVRPPPPRMKARSLK